MKDSTKLLALAMILTTVIGVCTLTRTDAQATRLAKGSSKVAVCDIVKVFKEYKRAKALTQKLTQRSRAFETMAKRKQEALEQLQEELKGLRPGSENYKATELKLKKGIIDREVWSRMEQEAIRREHLRATEAIFNEIKMMIGRVAQGNNIDLVVQLEAGRIQAKTSPELIAQIDRRKVLYNSKGIDLTTTVLTRLNNAYQP